MLSSNSHIYILTNTLKTGGAEKQTILLFKELSNLYDTRLIVYYGDQLDNRMLDLLGNDTSNVLFLRGSHLSKIARIVRLFRAEGNSVCISYLATTNAINAAIGKITKVKIRIGGIRSSKLNWFKEVIQRFLHNHLLTCSVFNNYAGYSELTAKGFNIDKSSVIHNCIEMTALRERKSPEEGIRLLTVGRYVEAKDYKTAMLAVKQLVDSSSASIKYYMVGHGVLENELRNFANKIGVSEYVEFAVNPPSVDKYYQQADIYLSTSLFEGLSNSIMEAMSFGLPVVATDVGDTKLLVKDCDTGYLVPCNDVKRISEKVQFLASHPEIREEMGRKGYAHIKDHFSIEHFTKQYVMLIEKYSNGTT